MQNLIEQIGANCRVMTENQKQQPDTVYWEVVSERRASAEAGSDVYCVETIVVQDELVTDVCAERLWSSGLVRCCNDDDPAQQPQFALALNYVRQSAEYQFHYQFLFHLALNQQLCYSYVHFKELRGRIVHLPFSYRVQK